MIAEAHPGGPRKQGRPLLPLLIAQSLGAFNDNAWKLIVTLLAVGTAASEAAGQAQAAWVQAMFLIPLILFNLPGGALADRLSKRTVIVGTKVLEIGIMLLGTAALWMNPSGGTLATGVLVLLGIQAALFGPSKYGILPELLPHEGLAAGNGVLEMWSNLAIIAGTAAGGSILYLDERRPWLGGLVLTALAAAGMFASLGIPRVPAARPGSSGLESLRRGWRAVRGDRILRLAVAGQVIVWSVACMVPAPVLSYAKRSLGLNDRMTPLPLAALGIGVGLGSLAVGRMSRAKVEYGFVPFGAIGLTACALAFGLAQPGFAGTILIMALLGVSAGLVFVPLNALIQWRAPAEARGAVIAVSNMLSSIGMLGGTFLALALARAGFSAQGTFLGAAVGLAAGTAWSLWLVPDAFLRFLLLLLAGTLYRLRVVGASNVPEEGAALLTPNHVSFADGLFLIGATDRPIRFVVYADYFERPLIGRFLRVMKAIPIKSSGGPRMILEAFRTAGRALDDGELVCIFPEGQITRTGMTLPFERGMERIVKGRDVPIIPVHLDRVNSSIFSPLHARRMPERIPLPITVSFGEPLRSPAGPAAIRRSMAEMAERAWELRRESRRPLHHEFIRRARRHPSRLAVADAMTPGLSYIKALAAAVALARALRPSWKDQRTVGIMLPTSVAGVLANLAAAISGRVVVNLNFTAGNAAMTSAAGQAGLRTLLTSRAFAEQAKLEIPDGVEVLWIEDVKQTMTRTDRAVAMALACLAPTRLLEAAAGAVSHPSVDDTAAIIFSSGSEGDPKGVVLSHFNIDSNIEAIGQAFQIHATDRIMDVLPLFHSFGYLLLWLGPCRGMGLACHVKPQEADVVGLLVEKYRATVLFATPAFLHIYTRRCAPGRFGSLRIVVAGADKLPEAIGRAFEDKFGLRPLEGYGATECSPVIAVNTLDFREPGFYQAGSRRGSVGQPLPGVSVRIVRPEQVVDRDDLAGIGSLEPLPPDTEGMVLVRGPNVMGGYLNRDDLTRRALGDGWYVSGDLGKLDEDGFLTITGRLSRFSKIGGEMVPHGRVEDALNEAIGAEEMVFAVTAVADGREGDRLAVLHTTTDDKVDRAIEGLKSRGLPNLFIPRRDQFVKVPALPMLGTGKLDLRALKREAAQLCRQPVG
ncbi:Bifunctional protein Aas [Aquisphaera giovannonii]|uniref:Bifunctional protein Aas n=1 Tax=Aquisphaera giovannonii TaxID=406548 RepID=A0A5B9VXN8_9BACT|nr:MFS transporter [Aquisphaera giovannonii]QEH32854.1 Bifunctional protein Aas [Aquisphaera giovannonii]